jgi:hypothetical protein
VDDAKPVSCGETLSGLDVDRQYISPGTRLGTFPGREGVALDPLHHEHDLIAVGDHVVDLHDVWMVELRERAGLREQAFVRAIVVLPRVQNLERDLAM